MRYSLLKTHICPGFKISGFTELMELKEEMIGENELKISFYFFNENFNFLSL